jgi:hypothetical protein
MRVCQGFRDTGRAAAGDDAVGAATLATDPLPRHLVSPDKHAAGLYASIVRVPQRSCTKPPCPLAVLPVVTILCVDVCCC